jgi:hypothetical protein
LILTLSLLLCSEPTTAIPWQEDLTAQLQQIQHQCMYNKSINIQLDRIRNNTLSTHLHKKTSQSHEENAPWDGSLQGDINITSKQATLQTENVV